MYRFRPGGVFHPHRLNACIKDYTDQIDKAVTGWRDSINASCQNDVSFKLAKSEMIMAKANLMKKDKSLAFKAIDDNIAILMDKIKKTKCALASAAAEKLKATTKRGDVGAEDDDEESPGIFDKLAESDFSFMKGDNMIYVF
jgi:hypothetical protein